MFGAIRAIFTLPNGGNSNESSAPRSTWEFFKICYRLFARQESNLTDFHTF